MATALAERSLAPAPVEAQQRLSGQAWTPDMDPTMIGRRAHRVRRGRSHLGVVVAPPAEPRAMNYLFGEAPIVEQQAPVAELVSVEGRRVHTTRRATAVLAAGAVMGSLAAAPDVRPHPQRVAEAQASVQSGDFQNVAEGAGRVAVPERPTDQITGARIVRDVFAQPSLNPHVAAREQALEDSGTAAYGLNRVELPGDFAGQSQRTGGATVLVPEGQVAVASDQDGLRVSLEKGRLKIEIAPDDASVPRSLILAVFPPPRD